jgi:LPXTG-motif cell wall-anchored protein
VNRYQVEPGPTLLPQQSWALSAEADFSGVITLLGVLTLGLAGVWLLQRRKGR